MTNIFERILNTSNEYGVVCATSFPLISAKGLPNVRPGEIVVFENGDTGQVISLEPSIVSVLVFSRRIISVNSKIVRTGLNMSASISDTLLNSKSSSLDLATLTEDTTGNAIRYPVDALARGISERVEITEPFVTGVSIVDMLIPLGKGQRELIIGDKQSGKTAFCLQILLKQSLEGAICIYACIGKKKEDIEYLEKFITKNNIGSNSVLITSSADDSLSNIYFTPYIAMCVAEYFRNNGKHVVLILDDLTTHAKYYREMSLLANKFPGRDSYPGDIFYTHSRLVERAGNFNEGSITLLPVVHTVEGDISGFIQTNLMSMTDGHVFFDKDLFYSGQRPAVDIHMSVTRVGRQTQSKLRWSINRELTSFFVLYQKTENFIHFGAELNEGIKNTLSTGRRLLQFFTQSPDIILDLNLQIFFFVLIWSGAWSSKSEQEVYSTMGKFIEAYKMNPDFKIQVDSIMDHSQDLNTLLGKIMKDVKSYDNFIN